MTQNELRQAAIDYLARAFKGEQQVEAYVVQAAVAVVLSPSHTAN